MARSRPAVDEARPARTQLRSQPAETWQEPAPRFFSPRRELSDAVEIRSKPRPARGAESQARRRRTVLVVDDEPDIADTLKVLLEACIPEVRVVATVSPTEALHVLDRQPIDLVIADYKMPGMDGFRFLDEVDRRRPDLPRILITAFVLELPQGGRRLQVDDFFAKPFRAPDMVASVVANLPRGP